MIRIVADHERGAFAITSHFSTTLRGLNFAWINFRGFRGF